MTDHAAAIRSAIQAMLDDAEGDGWVCSQYVICLGLERIGPDGVEGIPWVWTPGDQPHWQSLALLHEAVDLQVSRIEAD